jgi:hypothetical protein
MGDGTIASLASARVDAVRDNPADRYHLAAEFYTGSQRRRYQRAELSFLRWEIERGVLNALDLKQPGSPRWRSVSDRLLHDKVEADLLCTGGTGSPSSRRVELWVEFIRAPSATGWYRAHNASIVTGYLDHETLAWAELSAERFMMNVALLRVMYAHALAAAPRLALGYLAGTFSDTITVRDFNPLDGSHSTNVHAAGWGWSGMRVRPRQLLTSSQPLPPSAALGRAASAGRPELGL